MLRCLVLGAVLLVSIVLGAGCEAGAPDDAAVSEAVPAVFPAVQPSARPQPASTPAGRRLTVVATFSVLGDLVRQVGGERVAVRVLVGPESDVHTFDPSPADTAALAEAALVFENGLGFEPWLDRLYAASRSAARRVVVTEGLAGLIRSDAGHADEHREKRAESGVDPHVWHDVQNAMHMVGVIRDALVQADPANAATYRAHAERYLAELQALDAWIVAQVATVPPERRKLVTAHDTFAYFARRYGFTIIGTVLGAVTTEVADPSAAQVAALVRTIRAAGVPAIFAENVSNPRLMERIAREAGVEVVPGLYTDALGKPGSPGDTYVSMLRTNVERIVLALRR